jgi:hypothetical protein
MSEIGGKQTFHHIPRSSQKHGRAMSLKHDEYLAGQAMESGAYEDALRLLAPLARRNSEYALLSLGWIYEMGRPGLRMQMPPDRIMRAQPPRVAPLAASALVAFF